jgi:hypothetical protein
MQGQTQQTAEGATDNNARIELKEQQGNSTSGMNEIKEKSPVGLES